MLEIICIASLTWSINACQGNELMTMTGVEKVEIPATIQSNIMLDRGHIVSESDYRREADRKYRDAQQRRREIEYGEDHRDRKYRDAQQRRREIEYGEDHRDRKYRDAQQRRREIEYGEDHRDREYRDAQQRRREIEYGEDHRDREYRDAQQRRREIEYEEDESFQNLIENWLSE